MAKYEMTGIPEALLREFSQRRAVIDRREDELVAEFIATRGAGRHRSSCAGFPSRRTWRPVPTSNITAWRR